jgi:hypothetical protein
VIAEHRREKRIAVAWMKAYSSSWALVEAARHNLAHAVALVVALVKLLAGSSSVAVAGVEVDFVEEVAAVLAAAAVVVERAVAHAVVEPAAAVVAEEHEASFVAVRWTW